MPTLGTQLISTSYPQLLKTFGTGGIDGTLQVVTDGDDTSSALRISTTGVNSTGSLSVAGASTFTGAVTFGTSITASTGTATIGTLLASGPATFGTNITASTGTATLGTIASTTINNSGLATVGTIQVGASGPKLTVVSYGTASFTSATVAAHNGADATTGTFALTGVALNDIVIGSLNSMGSATGTTNIGLSIYPNATNIVEYSIQNQGATAGTIPAGIFSVAALRFTA
jgi:hypothetical protein